MRQTQVILQGTLCAVCGWPIDNMQYHFTTQNSGSAAVIENSNDVSLGAPNMRYRCRQS